MGLWWLALAASAHAAPVTGFAGVEWRPLSRADLVFVDEARASGTTVGEFDGVVRPAFGAFGGVWFSRYAGLSFGLGVAQNVQATRTQDAAGIRQWGVVRPSVDLRLGWIERRDRFPIPWFVVGAYGDVPTSRDRSDQYTDEEQAAADAAADNDRYRLGGVGGRVGAGVDYRVLPYLSLGAQLTVGVHAATYVGGDARFTTTWVATDASLLLTFEWPGQARSKATPPAPLPAEPVPAVLPVERSAPPDPVPPEPTAEPAADLPPPP